MKLQDFKFRVWDNTTKKYKNLTKSYIAFSVDKKGQLLIYEKISAKPLNDVNIEIYTGINDKNGKEIYEGDIIKVPKYDNPFEVFYLNGMACFIIINKDGDDFFKNVKEAEIIGNIHDESLFDAMKWDIEKDSKGDEI